jgi:subtilase family serine protease
MIGRSPHIALAMSALIACPMFAHAGTPFPSTSAPVPKDAGALETSAETAELTVTLPLKLSDQSAAEALLASISTPGSEHFRQFLTPAQFRAQFAPSDNDVATVAAYLSTLGLTTERSGATTLRVTGTPSSMEHAFQVSLHVFEVPADGSVPAFRFHAPTTAAAIPAEISGIVNGVIGLSTRPKYIPHYKQHAAKLSGTHETARASGLINPPGALTVADFSKYYDVLPLAAKHVTGEGRTLGIVTLASFTGSDAYAYWKAVGLKVYPHRIDVVDVDGGPGAPSDASGSLETTVDVEQSGGIAPGAGIIVYQAPNTDQAFLDAFVAAVESNTADSISTSWGEWEWFDNLANGAVIDPATGKTVSSLQAFHEIFLQAALQGQSLFAAAGDAGAYDANDGLLPPDYSLALSVDNPASDSFITAAGGTTLPGTQYYDVPKGTLAVNIPHERVWSWDYLVPVCDDLGYDPINCGIFPVGGGGGVSFEFAAPFYQQDLSGIQKTQPDQAFVDEDSIPPQTLVALPAYYAGRNLPDISFNADPDTGYVVFYTSDVSGFGEQLFWGGTSFVGPQLNGVVGLIGQYVHARLGLLNVPMYQLARTSGAYKGSGAPFNVIEYGNNDFYYGRDGYSAAAGIGTLDVANFADALKASY